MLYHHMLHHNDLIFWFQIFVPVMHKIAHPVFLPCIHVIMIMVYFVLQPISWINTVVVYSTNSPVKSVNSQS